MALAVLLALTQTGLAWSQALPAYNLQPGDNIEVSVYGEKDLERKLMVRPDGKFSMPLAGEIVAAGRTVADIQTELTGKFQKYIPEAVVTVSVTGIDGNRVYIIGQVGKPGAFVMNPALNVLQALSLAGGTTPFAAVNDIIVIRGTGADQKVIRFPYDEIKRGKALTQNIQLVSGDVVIVP
jgi:polysaccharide export outer membrane protein